MPLTNFPTSLDSWTDKTDSVDDVLSTHMNKVQDAINALELKVGADSSGTVTSLDYLLKSTSSSNPGHKHTLANGATDLTATYAEINSVVHGCTATYAEINTVCDGDAARNNHLHSNITVSAGSGMSGGGALSGSITLTLGTVAEGNLGSSSVSQAKLKTSTGSVKHTSGSGLVETLLTLPGGTYGFYPQIQIIDTLSRMTLIEVRMYYSTIAGSVAAATKVFCRTDGNYTAGDGIVVSQRYVTSSGEVYWIFILRDKITKQTIATYMAPDHPCFGNGGKPLLVSHPFSGDYDPTKHEIIVINPPLEQVAEMETLMDVDDDSVPDLSMLDVFNRFYAVDENSNPAWPTKKVTIGLPKGTNWQTMKEGTPVIPVKKKIPKPKNVIVKSLKRKEG